MIKRAAFALAAAFLLHGQAAAGTAARPVVVELFTSQGCSSCPPADQYLATLCPHRDVIAMSLPITYWDMLGWKDTLASEVNTQRQKAYAAAMGRGGVYTPEIVVDGAKDVVGSKDAEVNAAIEARANEIARAAEASLAVPVSIREDADAMRIGIGTRHARGDGPSTVWLFHLQDSAKVRIGAGENDGRTMTYRNVVRDIRPLGQWKGDALTLMVKRASLAGLPHDAVAVIVQQGGYGHVVGASLLSHPDYEAQH
ncbi:MAG: DUF1223 domain-containing protein [Alphaproteobacteria bacterium]|nr:DUF1223 domain-containing protein [Alphaproteobacteria bacterium]